SGLSVMPRVAGGCISFVAIVFVVGGCAIAGLVGSIGEGVDTFRSISTEFSRTTLEPPARAPSTASGSGAEDSATSSAESAEPPRGLARRSLLRRAEFTRAVTKLRGAGLGRPRSLRVAPDRIDTQLVTKTGRLRNVQIVPGGALRTISTTPSGGFSTQGLVSLAEIDRGAPARLVRSAAGRAQLPAARIDYLVLSQVGGKTRWVAFLQDGPGYLADRSGRIEQKVR
ncbi:MAG: hypothetical protein H0V81_18120, partial [Solirubrobacterales bacterium]|nr:hypothetical protein [Solirubrobacterales bacterium]